VTEKELLASIEAHNNGLPEQNTKAELICPSGCTDQKGAAEALRAFKALAARRNVRCIMCDATIEEQLDTLGRLVKSTTYCSTRCSMAGRSLLAELMAHAGLEVRNDTE
jgi:hypothetical protein